MLLVAGFFVFTEKSMQAGDITATVRVPVNLLTAAVRGALNDKIASQSDDLHHTDYDEKGGCLDEGDSTSQDALIWLEEALYDVPSEDDSYPKRVLKCLRDYCRFGFESARDYSLTKCKRLYDYSRACYWASKVILPDECECNRVFVFSREDQLVNMINCKTTDGYEFFIPYLLIGDGFLNDSVSGNFIEYTNHLKYAQNINLNSRVMYLLCTAKRLQEAQKVESDTLLEGVAMRLNDRELFDAIKACSFLNITHTDILVPLYCAVVSVLQTRHPLGIALNLINKELEYNNQLCQQVVAAFKKIVVASLSIQELPGVKPALVNNTSEVSPVIKQKRVRKQAAPPVAIAQGPVAIVDQPARRVTRSLAKVS
jgi:hypothetical protein